MPAALRASATGSPGMPFIPPPLTVAIDPIIDTTLAANTFHAWGFDLWVQGYTGNTCQLKRVSDGMTRDFGLTSMGNLDFNAVVKWASGSDVTVVGFYDQKGSKFLPASIGSGGGTICPIYLIRDNRSFRHNSSVNVADGQVSWPSNRGGIGCIMDPGCNFDLAATSVDSSSGVEFHLLMSMNNRRSTTTPAATGYEPLDLKATSVQQNMFTYGLDPNNFCSYDLGVNTAQVFRLSSSAGGDASRPIIGGGINNKAKSRYILSFAMDSTSIRGYVQGYKPLNFTVSTAAGTATTTQFSNGRLLIGRRWPGYTGGGQNDENTKCRGDLFSGFAITKPLTDTQRKYVQSAMGLLTVQHLNQTIPNIISNIIGSGGEIMDARDINSVTGAWAGRLSNMTIQVNIATLVGGNTPSWAFNSTATDSGQAGLYNGSKTNYANFFKATNSYFANVLSGSMLAFGRMDGSSFGQWFMDGTGSMPSGATQTNANWSKGLGVHHAQSYAYTRASATYDSTGYTAGEGWTDNPGGNVAQSMLKYLHGLAHGDWNESNPNASTSATITNVMFGSNTVASGTPITQGYVSTISTVAPPTPENRTWPLTGNGLGYSGHDIIHISTFQAPPQYVTTDSQANRNVYLKRGTNYSYVSNAMGTLPGDFDGGFASQVGNGNVLHSDPSACIMSGSYLENFVCWRFMFIFSPRVWSADESLTVMANLYKIFRYGYT